MTPSHTAHSANSSDAERSSTSSSGDDASSNRIVVLGGGEAGLAFLDALADHALIADVALIEPSTYDYDQPRWMQVGTDGDIEKEDTRSRLGRRIPSEVTWIQERVESIDPQNQSLGTEQTSSIHYDYLVIALGIGTHWDRIRNLTDHLGTQGICSVYGYEQAERTWEMIRTFKGGRAIFTSPSTPHKGGSAPRTLLRRAKNLWRERGVLDQTDLFYTTAASSEALDEDVDLDTEDADLHVYTGYDLIDVRPERREAVFAVTKGRSQSRDVLDYDLLHVVPPMRPPALVEDCGLAYRNGPMKGYLEVDPDSLRHPRFERVFGVGDVIGVEGVKTGERARKQATHVARTLEQIVSAEGT